MQTVVFFNTEDQKDLDIEQRMIKGTDIELVLCNDEPNENVVEKCKDADAIITIYTPMTKKIMKELKQCKVIAVQAIGFNNLDIDGATENGICLANVPDFCLYDVALQTVSLTLAATRHIVQLNNQVKSGNWGYEGYKMHRLRGQVFGTVAFGNIPKTMTPMLKALGMEVVTYDPWVTDEVLIEYGVKRMDSLEQLVSCSDYISVHCPLTKENVGLIGENEFNCMKSSAIVLNTARGGIIDERALYDALKNGRIAGAALDVLTDEKDGDNPLYQLDNIIITPHTAFYSEESMVDMRIKAMEQVMTVLLEKMPPKHLINKDVLNNARFAE